MGKHTSFSFSYYRIWPIWWEEDLWGGNSGKDKVGERERESGMGGLRSLWYLV